MINGTKSAQDILQLEMHKMLSGIPSQVNIADDILIGESVKEHDHVLACARTHQGALPKLLYSDHKNSRLDYNLLESGR
ncbi:Hypothetical predicted protein [Paramuricea clavata]|uniref:Uncharacterized protein n=1 Tax=Paramuricea clavata TaxID=317549 RepID=A0A7D9ID12_PARCT|nr:Hypothetical predicted protein [Paramuricea clavata]